MIIVTGAAGFIGSCMVSKLNNKGFKDIVLVDDFSKTQKLPNTLHKRYREMVERIFFFDWFSKHSGEVDFIFHLGARTDTTEFNMAIFEELNLNFSKKLWGMCTQYQIPLIYASSAATYGDGTLGYDDHDPELSFRLQPLNPYGISKNEFDKWALQQTETPPKWYGLKFFNVYGPNEYHKGRMASVVYHAYCQIADTGYSIQDTGSKIQDMRTGPVHPASSIQHPASSIQHPGSGFRHPSSVKLFRSHNPLYKDGGQLRDFIYVKDVTDVMYFLMNHNTGTKQDQRHDEDLPTHPLVHSPTRPLVHPSTRPPAHPFTRPLAHSSTRPLPHSPTPPPSGNSDSGVYNLGTGKARTFLDLVNTVFAALDKPASIEFIDTPIDIRDKYQYFTQANIKKLQSLGYSKPFYTLETGIEEYVQGYLVSNICY